MMRSLLLDEALPCQLNEEGEPRKDMAEEEFNEDESTAEENVDGKTCPRYRGEPSSKPDKNKAFKVQANKAVKRKFIFTPEDEYEITTKVRESISHICSRKKRARLGVVTDREYSMTSPELRQKMDRKQFYDKICHLGLGKELW